MLAFMFVEYFNEGESSAAWALGSFEPRNEPYYQYVETVADTLKQS